MQYINQFKIYYLVFQFKVNDSVGFVLEHYKKLKNNYINTLHLLLS